MQPASIISAKLLFFSNHNFVVNLDKYVLFSSAKRYGKKKT